MPPWPRCAPRAGCGPLRISHVAYPDRRFDTPSGKVELSSERAARSGCPPLPVYEARSASVLSADASQGRTLTHFHGFYDHGRALPTLARLDPEPRLWISPADAAAREVADGAAIRIHNERGELRARAQVTDRISAGTVWMRDGWEGLNRLTSGRPAIADEIVDTSASRAARPPSTRWSRSAPG